jgi:hypothetical protein
VRRVRLSGLESLTSALSGRPGAVLDPNLGSVKFDKGFYFIARGVIRRLLGVCFPSCESPYAPESAICSEIISIQQRTPNTGTEGLRTAF